MVNTKIVLFVKVCFALQIVLNNGGIPDFCEIGDFKCTESQIQKPKTTIAFLKTHKCASNSISNILLRYAFKQNLTVVLPDHGHDMMTNGKKTTGFSKNLIEDTTWFKAGLRPQILALHSFWDNFTAVEEVMKMSGENPILMTIFRDPVEVLISLWDYSNYETRAEMTLDKFFGENRHLSSKLSNKFQVLKRPLFNDFGAPFITSDESIERKITEIDNKFHLVMIVEEFDASMVLLKKVLNWNYEDLVSLKLNSRVSSKKSKISESTRTKIKMWLKDDYKLYNHFRAVLSIDLITCLCFEF